MIDGLALYNGSMPRSQESLMSTTAANDVQVPARLAQVREVMAGQGISALLVPSADPHLSEYLPRYWQGRRWLSGFHGSVGTMIVTPDFAGLWVDSRYWEQAEKELAGTGIALMKLVSGQPGALEWLPENVAQGATVAVDGAVMALAAARSLNDKLATRGASLRTDLDLLSDVWLDRPALPVAEVFEHAPPFASEDRQLRLSRLREALRDKAADWHFLATLDDIAWLFNLRGADVSYNPVFLAFALVGEGVARLYVADGKIAETLRASLLEQGVEVRDYADISVDLQAVPAQASVLLDPAKVTVGLTRHLQASVRLIEGINPTTLFKSRKNDADVAHVRQAMEQDGAALCEFFSWLESALGEQTITEVTIDEQLTAARARRPDYISASFATIAAFNANGAMPHYRATAASHATLEGNGLLLIDSGGQYLGGTTDITRMVPIGLPTEAQRRDCTRVLKGMIALSRARFPRGIASPLLDAIARAPLWADNVDYGHGTGHGVGYFLNVHEGPQVIAYQAAPGPQTAMQQGMITSVEPGTYRPGQWGVRIENLVLTQEAGESEFGDFLRFETLTLCPIDTRCLLRDELSREERLWLDDYHAEVRQRLTPLLSGAALEWMRERTERY
jgi:Xaa-Pro aminopeptidase